MKISCNKDVSEPICSFLMERGALGAVEENIFIKSVSLKSKANIWIKGYFQQEADFLSIQDALRSFLLELKKNFQGFKKYRIIRRLLQDKNWREGYKKFFKPIKVSKHIVVKPDYADYTAKKGEKIIVINPQMAFGIGNHPTTKMCIKYIDELLAHNNDKGGLTMLDVGTGSGILAIAAALLGAGKSYGFDTDPIAYETAVENITKNGVINSVKLGCHSIEQVKGKYDLVVANILASTLIEAKEELLRTVKVNGDIILSGILKDQADEVIKAFVDSNLQNLHVKLVSTKKEKEWVALHFSCMLR